MIIRYGSLRGRRNIMRLLGRFYISVSCLKREEVKGTYRTKVGIVPLHNPCIPSSLTTSFNVVEILRLPLALTTPSSLGVSIRVGEHTS
jgi:hypothetical protein